jgi:hypothetical protein
VTRSTNPDGMGHPSDISMTSGIAKKNAGAPEGGRRSFDMLNVLEMPDKAQGLHAFIREGFTLISPVQANQVLLHAAYEGQRKIQRTHVDVLADLMKREQWLAKNQLDFAELDGRLLLVNGYHRMNAQVASGKSIVWTVVIHPCRSEAEVRSLYYKFDTNARTRTGVQIIAGVGFAEQHGLSATMAEKLFNAVPIIASGFSKAVKDRDTLTTRVTDRRLALAREYVPAAKLYEQCLGRLPVKIGSKFRSAGVTAVALATLRYQPKRAVEFWTGTALNDGLSKGDPRLALYNDMLSRAMNVGSTVQSIYAPAYAWNAWFEDKQIKIIKVYAARSVAIAGTPWE